jgi:hypothetical protein
VFAENLDAFFDSVAGHAVAATYDGGTAVKVIFDAAYLEQFGVAGVRPVAVGKASVFPANAVGKTLLIGATTYVIKGREQIDDGALVALTLRV